MSLSSHEYDEVKPLVQRAVEKFLGYFDEDLMSTSLRCVSKGYDVRKVEKKLTSLLSDKDARKFSDRLLEVVDSYKEGASKKRKNRFTEKDESASKKPKVESAAPVPPEVAAAAAAAAIEEDLMAANPDIVSPGQLNSDKIKEMMKNAQRLIEERKQQMSDMNLVPSAPSAPPPTRSAPAVEQGSAPGLPTTAGPAPTSALNTDEVTEKMRKAAALHAQIQAALPGKLAAAGVAGATFQPPPLMGPPPAEVKKEAPSAGPTPLILDEHGRTIDAKTGEAVQLSHHVPTLKANIRALRREQFKKELQDKPPDEPQESRFFDMRVALKGASRPRRGFKFHEKGKFEQIASKLRTKAQLEKLQSEIAQAAKKTGIASAAKLATIQSKQTTDEADIPDVEWWDSVILPDNSYVSSEIEGSLDRKLIGITNLVEHPTKMKNPTDPGANIQLPIMLTKRERKKLRRQSRMEGQKEIQEKVRLGLMPPPEPKVKMANLMRVLGTEAIQDPTKIEAHVRAQMAKRYREHQERNAARKLTKEQQKEKKIKKIKEDTTLGVDVSVYRVSNLSNPSHKFKVETNAKQLLMTGTVVLHKDCNVVVVEGGPKQQKKFRQLMLKRIKWSEGKAAKAAAKEGESGGEGKSNKCVLVWQGQVKSRSFGEMKFKLCPTESFACEQFRKSGVEHYWDLAFSGAVIEAAGEDL